MHVPIGLCTLKKISINLIDIHLLIALCPCKFACTYIQKLCTRKILLLIVNYDEHNVKDMS